MHDEFEKAVTGGATRRGLSPMGWIVLAVAFFGLVGTLGVGFVAYRVASGVGDEIRSAVTRELGATPGVVAARMASRLAGADELVSLDPEAGLALLSDMDGEDAPMDVLRTMASPLGMPDGSAHPDAPEDGGGASLRIRSGDSRVAFDLSRTEDGGLLTIDSDEGRVNLQLVEGDGGGHLRIQADHRDVVVSFGGEAEGAPRWVDRVREIPGRAQPVASIRSDRGRLGAVAWESSEDPSELLASWAEAVEAEGYEVKVEHRVRDGAEAHGSLWGRHAVDERMIFVVAHRDHRGRSGVLVGYGEKR
jgi:hypothetical protein